MRIIAGTAKGRRLSGPAKMKRSLIRPTSDRAREALFNIISQKIIGAQVLDLFAGTGALGLESLSRGAAACLAVDNNKESLRLIRGNSAACFFADKLTLIKRDLRKGLIFLQNFKPVSGFSLVFLDPPYNKELSSKIFKELADGSLLATQATVIIEEDGEVELPSGAGCLSLHDKRIYGGTGFWFYTRK